MDDPFLSLLSLLNLSFLYNLMSEHAEVGDRIFLFYEQRIDKFCEYF